jgi:hypothetical protein
MKALPAIAALFACVAVAPAAAQCPSATVLTNGVSVAVTTDPKIFSVTPASTRWSAVGVRRADAANWDVEARNTTAVFPTCYTGTLATSNQASGIDFLVTDWRFRASQIDYVGVATAALNGTSARAEFEQAGWDQIVNDVYDHVIFGSSDVLSVREVSLGNLNRYAVVIKPSAGTTGLKLWIFAPATSGSGWFARGARLVEQTLVAGSLNHVDLPSPIAAGTYALVVTNEDGVAGDYWMTVKSCPLATGSMVDNVPEATVRSEYYRGFTPPAHTWGVTGIRGDGWQYNWDVAPGSRLVTWFDWTCSDSVLAQQSDGAYPSVRLVAGDFRSNPLRLYSAHASQQEQPQSASLGWLEWEDGQDALVVDAPATNVTPPDHNVLDAWSVSLVGGTSYVVTLVPNVGTNALYRVLVFANPSPGSPYWATRQQAAAFIQGSGPYLAPATGLYGIVVVNDDGGTGGYTIRVTSTNNIGVDPPGPGAAFAITRIRAVAPTPTFAGARIDYALASAGRVGLRVTDVTGRIVAEDDAGIRAAGEGSVAWSGRSASGARPPAGVYFVTLVVDGVPRDRARLIVLR